MKTKVIEAAPGIKPPNCSPAFWKDFPSFSQRLGNRAIKDKWPLGTPLGALSPS